MNVLVTGASGFMGTNIVPIFKKIHRVFTPERDELDLFDLEAIKQYLEGNSIDVVIHFANPNPVKYANLDTTDKMFENSMRMFMNLYHLRNCYKRMIYIGSGAEYDKRFDIINVKEDDVFKRMPIDSYGLAKHISNKLIQLSDNIFNCCVFGCYGPGDFNNKFITHCINCCKTGSEITIKQDCKFDFLHVYDLGRYLLWMIDADLKHKMYNASSGHHMYLSEIANIVKEEMKSDLPIVILKDGYNLEYTANGERLFSESGLRPKVSIEEGIKIQIESQKDD